MTAALSSMLGPNQPFPGLRPYFAADHAWFFGRDSQVSALYLLLNRARFIAVVGSSGSGKSSLVAAGLIPKITREKRIDKEGNGQELPRWRCLVMRPGDAPFGRLADSIAGPRPTEDNDATSMYDVHRDTLETTLRESSFGLATALREIAKIGPSSVLLVVDQFEEIFRFASITRHHNSDSRSPAVRGDEAAAFVQLLVEASNDTSVTIHVMLTMRSDYIGECARFSGLAELVAANQFLVPMLTRDQREKVIREPIAQAEGSIDDTFVQRLLNDSAGEFDQLPVLQHALMRLWTVASRRQAESDQFNPPSLTQADYKAIGGIAQALDSHADEVWKELGGEEPSGRRTHAVEQCFRALAELDKEGRAVRRALPFERLVAETGVKEQDVADVVNRFRQDDCSFLLPPPSEPLGSRTLIDIGHEALIRNWKRLSGGPAAGPVTQGRDDWLAQEAESGMTYRLLLNLATGKSTSGGPTLPLDQIEERLTWWNRRNRTEAWAERYGDQMDAVLTLFKNSRGALAAEHRRERRARRATKELARQRAQAVLLEQKNLRERAEQQEKLARFRALMNWIISFILLIALISTALALWGLSSANEKRDEAIATTIWSRLVLRDSLLGRDEVDALWELANSGARVQKYFIDQMAGENPIYLEHLGWGQHSSLPVFWALGPRLPSGERARARDVVLRHLDAHDAPVAAHAARALISMVPWLPDQDVDAALARLFDLLAQTRADQASQPAGLISAAEALAARVSEPMRSRIYNQVLDHLIREDGQNQASAIAAILATYGRFGSESASQDRAVKILTAIVREPGKCISSDLAFLASSLSSDRALNILTIVLNTLDRLGSFNQRSCLTAVGAQSALRLNNNDAQSVATVVMKMRLGDVLPIATALTTRAGSPALLWLLDMYMPSDNIDEMDLVRAWNSLDDVDLSISRLSDADLAPRAERLVRWVFGSLRDTPFVNEVYLHFLKVMTAHLSHEDTKSAIFELVKWPDTDGDGLAELAAIAEGLSSKLDVDQARLLLGKISSNLLSKPYFDRRLYPTMISAMMALMRRANASDLILSQLVQPQRRYSDRSAFVNIAVRVGDELASSEAASKLMEAIMDALDPRSSFLGSSLNVDDVTRLTRRLDDAQVAHAFNRIMERLLSGPSKADGQLAIALADRSPSEMASVWIKRVLEKRMQMTVSDSRVILSRVAAELASRLEPTDNASVGALARWELAASNSDEEAVAWASVIVKLLPREPSSAYFAGVAEILTYPTTGGAAGKVLMDQMHERDPDMPGAAAGLPATVEWIQKRYGVSFDKFPQRPQRPESLLNQ